MLIIHITFGPQPWISWEDTHSNFNRFDRFSAVLVEANPSVYSTYVVHLWGDTLGWVLFIIFLGTGPAHRKQYRHWFFSILRPFGIQPPLSPVDSPWGLERTGASTTHMHLTSTLPPYSPPHASKKFPEKLNMKYVEEDRVPTIGLDRGDYPKGATEKCRGRVIV
jgi:hypothetical protein